MAIRPLHGSYVAHSAINSCHSHESIIQTQGEALQCHLALSNRELNLYPPYIVVHSAHLHPRNPQPHFDAPAVPVDLPSINLNLMNTKRAHKSDEDPQGKRGNCLGLIVQPNDTWAACHSSSPEPLAKPGSLPSDSGMADQRAADEGLEVKVISKGEAICRVTAYLGFDALRMPDSVLKEVLGEMPEASQADPLSPMEIKGGTAPALLQLADRMVLGRGPQPSTGGTPVAAPRESEAQLGYPGALSPPGQLALEALPNDDSATEPDSEPEIIELRPEDSVSQRVPLAPRPIATVPLPSQPVLTPLHAKRSNPNTATVDESDDTNTEITHNTKQQRLNAQLPRATHSPPASILYTRTHTPPPAPRISSSIRHTPTHTVVPGGRAVAPTVFTPCSTVSSSLVNPPPTSDVDAVLVWATCMAAKAANSNVVANPRAGLSDQAGRTEQASDQYGLLTSVLENVRLHLATSAPKSQANTRRRLRRPKNTDFIEDDAELLEAEAALALGKHIRLRQKPCLADFPGFRRHIASSAIPSLNTTLVTQGMYEVYGTVIDWAEKSYNRTWDAELPDEPLQKAPAPLLAILLPNQFHCRDPKTGTNPYEHPGLQVCIATGLFWGPESLGAVFWDQFQPLSLAAVAFILTIMQHCIEEWGTGRYVKTELNIDVQRKVYESHIEGLLAYDQKAPTRLREFRGGWFKYGLKHAGALTGPKAPYQPTTRTDQICTDSPAHNVDPTAHAAKGKGRAVY